MWRAQFSSKTHLGSNIWEFKFQKPSSYDFLPGQYAHFYLNFDDEWHSRTMSITSLPEDNYITFITRISGNPSPYKSRLMNLGQEDEIGIDSALGDLILPMTPHQLVFVAGGIGLASFVGMVRENINQNNRHHINLLQAYRTEDEEALNHLIQNIEPVHHKKFTSTNRLDINDVLRVKSDLPIQYYLSGGEDFVLSLKSQLESSGLDHSKIALDYFTGYTEQEI